MATYAQASGGVHDRSDRHHRDVPPHHPRARGGQHRPPARAHLGASRALGSHRVADRRPHGARRPRRGVRRPSPGAHRRRAPQGRARDAQAPPGRAPAQRRHRARVGVRARGGVPLGARDERAGGAQAAHDARAPDRIAVRKPHPGPGGTGRFGAGRHRGPRQSGGCGLRPRFGGLCQDPPAG